MFFHARAVRVVAAASLLVAGAVAADDGSVPGATLDGVRSRLIEANPELQAMAFEVQAMRAREVPAAALSDSAAQAAGDAAVPDRRV